MNHVAPEQLALIALSDQEPTPEERAHLETCAECAGELSELSRTVGLARSAGDVQWERPSDAVWERIRTELGLRDAGAGADAASASRAAHAEPAAASVSPETAEPAAASVSPETAEPAPVGAPNAATSAAEPSAPPAPVGIDEARARRDAADARPARGSRRSARFWVPIVAAAAVLGLVAGAVVTQWVGAAPGASPADVIATAQLDAFPGWPGASGNAVVEQLADGSREVVVDVDAAAADATAGSAPLREVWLIKGDGSGLVSIGFMDGTQGRFLVPSGIALADYPLVDISAEQDDGVPAHSGDSIVRGELRPV